eukprot:10082919-Alexandrium_andersonii.AAC.1
MVCTQEGTPVIRLRNHSSLPKWCTGCSNFLFVVPLPTEAGGYCSGLERMSAPWSGLGCDAADRQDRVYFQTYPGAPKWGGSKHKLTQFR